MRMFKLAKTRETADVEEKRELDEIMKKSLKTPNDNSFFCVRRSFIFFLFSVLISGLKGLFLLISKNSGTGKIETGDLIVCWQNIANATIFLGGVLFIFMQKTSIQTLYELTAAFLINILSIIFFSIIMLVECLGDSSQICIYLFPASGFRIVHLALNLSMHFILFFFVISYLIRLTYKYESIVKANFKILFAWQGSLFVVLYTVVCSMVHLYNSVQTCINDFRLQRVSHFLNGFFDTFFFNFFYYRTFLKKESLFCCS